MYSHIYAHMTLLFPCLRLFLRSVGKSAPFLLFPLWSTHGASLSNDITPPTNMHAMLLTSSHNPNVLHSSHMTRGKGNTHPQHTHISHNSWHAVLIDGAQLALGCAQGHFHPLENNTTCGLPAGYSEDVLTWDPSRLSTALQWKDLWNVVQLPGQRALPKRARLTLEIALLSDNVPPNQIYRTLSSSQGIDHAFHRLDQLRPYIVWWSTPHDAQRLMQKTRFLMGIVPHESLNASTHCTKASYTADTSYALYTALFWGIPNTENSTTIQSTRSKLRTHLPRINAQTVPNSDKVFEIDNHFWTIHGPMLEARFTAWLNH